MNKTLLTVVGLILILSCNERESIITIVDIGYNDRIELGRQLRIINKFSPKVVALDFHLVPDSLDKDTILVKELMKIKNSVQAVALYDLIESLDIWDSLKVSHPKFRVLNYGFANVTTEDSVLVKELPMQQLFRDKTVYAFSYVVAQNSFGVKAKYLDTGNKDLKLQLKGLGENYKLITRKDLATGNFKEEDLNDKIVLLGYIGGEEDYFYLDKKKRKRINGVEIQAAIVDEIIKL